MFLQQATFHQLEQAVAANHREWMIRKAQAANGYVLSAPGVTWTYTGPFGEAMILFPQLTEANANDVLDGVIRYYLEHQPKPLVGCWSLLPTQPPDLDSRLLARGFQPGWQPCWMWLDLQNLKTGHPQPDGLTIARVDTELPWDVDQLPYYAPEDEPFRRQLHHLYPDHIWHFAAYLNGAVVGHTTLCMTTGTLGVAGLYDMGVVPTARNQGIGKALVRSACLQAHVEGCRYMLLNATGERMYRQVGFDKLGDGITWWLSVPRLARHRPSERQIVVAEAVTRGDLAALIQMELQASDINTPLANGMTLIDLATHTEQSMTRDWLIVRSSTS